MNEYDYIIYTDGAYSHKHDEGAWAYVMLDANMDEIRRNSGKICHETNNRAKLKAIIAAVYQAPLEAKKIKIITDSRYAIKTLTKEWNRNTNHDLLDLYDRLIVIRRVVYEWVIDYEWMKSHSGNKYNEICNAMCNDVFGYDTNAGFSKVQKKEIVCHKQQTTERRVILGRLNA